MNASNEEQITYWNGSAGDRWRELADRTEAAFAPVVSGAIEAAAPQAGERALDVGCGCGATTLLLAERVAPGGSVTGLDMSAPMLERARERVRDRRIGNVELVEDDATVCELPASAFDLLFSQFGVMFFADPTATFAHLRTSLKPAARLTFTCWRGNEENPFFAVPAGAARKYIAAPPPPPDAPSPVAFADPARVRHILTAAGFNAIELVPRDTPARVGNDVDDALSFLSRLGGASRLLDAAEPAARTAAVDAMREALAAHAGPEGVYLTAGTWIVSARVAG